MHIDTLAIHAGQAPDPTTGAIMPPVYQTSTYVQDAPGQPRHGYEYARSQNPTRSALEANLAALEGGRHGVAFASGCAATSTIMHLLRAGDHVVCGDDVYGGTFRLFRQVFEQCGISFTFVDLTAADALEAAIRPETRMLWVETPTNPLLKILDLARLTEISHGHGLTVVCDNTFATPVFQRPLALGCDLVLHSTTKFMGGHSDVVGGAVITNDDGLAERLLFLQNSIGAVPGPWDAWLVLRGTKTLPLRMRAHDANGRRVAAFLESHAEVERVIYPGLPSHPQHELASRQMSGFGGMISAVVRGGAERATRFIAGLGIDDGLIRLSVGVEHIDDLLTDLDRALVTSR
jgi:cystathionine gamma-lyase